MPTVMTHAAVGVALGTLTSFPARRRLFWIVSVALPGTETCSSGSVFAVDEFDVASTVPLVSSRSRAMSPSL